MCRIVSARVYSPLKCKHKFKDCRKICPLAQTQILLNYSNLQFLKIKNQMRNGSSIVHMHTQWVKKFYNIFTKYVFSLYIRGLLYLKTPIKIQRFILSISKTILLIYLWNIIHSNIYIVLYT